MVSLEEKLESIQKYDIKEFEIKKELGAGTYGTTYLATKGTEQIVIKQFKKLSENENIKKLIKREIKNLAFINHNRLIIGFKGISFINTKQERSEYPLLILDYAENGSLEGFLKEKRENIEDTEKMILLYGIAKAMNILHSSNIVHRDLKPDNVLLDKNNYPLLSDFGSSRVIDPYNPENISENLGTPLYMAPEVYEGELTHDISMKSDVFSYSMIMYYILTGKKPFEGIKTTGPLSVYNYLKDGSRLSLPNKIPSYFRYLITLLWQQNPNERPDFLDIIRLFETGFILPSILTDETSKTKYLEYMKYVSMIKHIDPENLFKLQTRLRDEENKIKLSFVITFFLADYLNDSNSQKEIGNHYMSGTILNRDPSLGFQYLQKAADQDNKEALFLLGHSYENGSGCTMNPDKSLECFQKSADLGYQPASNYLQEKDNMKNICWDRTHKVAIIGSSSTGKTTLVNYMINAYKIEEIKPTVSTIMHKVCLKCRSEDNSIQNHYIRVVDSRGMDSEGGKLLPIFCRDASVVIVLFDISIPKTFDDIDKWIDEFKSFNSDALVIIVGNKIDLERTIPKTLIDQKVCENNADYVEISALKQINIDILKQKIVQKLGLAPKIDYPNKHSVKVNDCKKKSKCC